MKKFDFRGTIEKRKKRSYSGTGGETILKEQKQRVKVEGLGSITDVRDGHRAREMRKPGGGGTSTAYESKLKKNDWGTLNKIGGREQGDRTRRDRLLNKSWFGAKVGGKTRDGGMENKKTRL